IRVTHRLSGRADRDLLRPERHAAVCERAAPRRRWSRQDCGDHARGPTLTRRRSEPRRAPQIGQRGVSRWPIFASQAGRVSRPARPSGPDAGDWGDIRSHYALERAISTRPDTTADPPGHLAMKFTDRGHERRTDEAGRT